MERFQYRANHPHSSSIIDQDTGRWMSCDLVRQMASALPENEQLRATVAELEEKLWAETKALNAERIATTSRAEQIEELKEAVAAYAEQLETRDAYRTVQAIIRQQAEQIKVARAELQRVKAICLRECGVGVVDENVLAKLSPTDSPV